jgi:lipoate-protein ligase A
MMLKRISLLLDRSDRDGAMNMALDEALLQRLAEIGPVLRFYRWSRPWITFGYFTRWQTVEQLHPGAKAVRRWTGGGIVRHDDDLTYSLISPPLEVDGSILGIYEVVHEAIACAFGNGRGQITQSAGEGTPKTDSCFDSPVRSDLMFGGKKIAGAALRRHRRGLLLQGSIQGIAIPKEFELRFAATLAEYFERLELSPAAIAVAERLCHEKYGSLDWNRKF